jgi:NAD-dependent dihydropyrimidine dehydrogenase PreA subunit
LGRSRQLYELVMRLWPLSKVAYKLGNLPFLSPLFRPIFSDRSHQALIVPVNQVIQQGKSVVLPYTLLPPLVDQASSRFILSHCMCRRNEDCHTYPQEIGCLFLGDGAAQINPDLGQPASAESARAHIQQALQAGLVPLIAHTVFDSYLFGIPYRRMLTICFCCDCCCTVRHGLRLGPPAFWEIVNRLPGLRIEVNEGCLGCGSCLESCSVQAIQLVDSRAAIGESCKGCGVCVEACPVGAIQLHLDDQGNTLDRLFAGIDRHTDIRGNGKQAGNFSSF